MAADTQQLRWTEGIFSLKVSAPVMAASVIAAAATAARPGSCSISRQPENSFFGPAAAISARLRDCLTLTVMLALEERTREEEEEEEKQRFSLLQKKMLLRTAEARHTATSHTHTHTPPPYVNTRLCAGV